MVRPWWVPAALGGAVTSPRIERHIFRTYRAWDGERLPDQIIQFGSVAVMRAEAEAGGLPPGTFVAYDLERWDPTPADEQAHPYRSMRRFVSTAHAHGLVAILAPGGNVGKRAARMNTDYFLAQVQRLVDPARFREAVCRLARANPNRRFIAEMSVNRRYEGHLVTATDLYRQWNAGRRCADGFALWSYHVPEDGSIPPEQLVVAQEFFDRIGAPA